MFNEFEEYNEYTRDILTSNRIVPFFTLKNAKFHPNGVLYSITFSGLQRILKIIARRWLFHDDKFAVVELSSNMNERMGKVYFAKDKMLNWCINEDFDSPFCEYLKQFAEKKSENQSIYDSNKSFLFNEWQSFVERHNYDLFSPITEKNENAWYFDGLIAEAIEEGPLKKFSYTLCNENLYNQIATANGYNKKNQIPSNIIDIAAYIRYESPQENKYPIAINDWGNYFRWSNGNNSTKLQDSLIKTDNSIERIFLIDKDTGLWELNPHIASSFSFKYDY